jgi:type I restriction enzyme R subunit
MLYLSNTCLKPSVTPSQSRATAKGAEDQIKELISRSIESDDIVDVFAMAGLERADISILNEEFLLGAKQAKDSIDIKIALMKAILMDELKLRLHKNIKKYTSLKEELERFSKTTTKTRLILTPRLPN